MILTYQFINYYENSFFFTEELYSNQKEIPRNHFLIPKSKIYLFNSAFIFYG